MHKLRLCKTLISARRCHQVACRWYFVITRQPARKFPQKMKSKVQRHRSSVCRRRFYNKHQRRIICSETSFVSETHTRVMSNWFMTVSYHARCVSNGHCLVLLFFPFRPKRRDDDRIGWSRYAAPMAIPKAGQGKRCFTSLLIFVRIERGQRCHLV